MGRGGTPAREISFVSLMAYGPKVSHSALAMGVYSFWNQAGRFPTINLIIILLGPHSPWKENGLTDLTNSRFHFTLFYQPN